MSIKIKIYPKIIILPKVGTKNKTRKVQIIVNKAPDTYLAKNAFFLSLNSIKIRSQTTKPITKK